MSQPSGPSDERGGTGALAVPLAVGLALRLLWIAICPNEPTSDQVIYHQSAIWFSEGRGYVGTEGTPAGYWPVGYVALLGTFYAIFGTSPIVAFLMNTLLGGITIASTYGLARTLFGEAVGRAAAWIVALLPTLVLYTTCIASENAVLAGLLAGTWLMAVPVEGSGATRRLVLRRRLLLDLGAGVVLAATAYVRGTAIPFALLPLALALRSPLRALLRVGVVAACVIVLLLPWGERNRDAFGAFSLTSINAGANLWMGNHEGTHGMAAPLPEDLPPGLAERDAELRARAVRFIMEDPARFVGLMIKRSWVTLRSDTIAAVWNEVGLERRFGRRGLIAAKVLCTAGYFALLAATALGLRRRYRSRTLGFGDAAIALAVALVAVPFVVIVGGNRYQMPMQPFLACWAGAFLAGVLAERASGRTGARTTGDERSREQREKRLSDGPARR